MNNAGATWGAATVDLPLAAWQKVIDLNLTAMFLVTQEVGRRSMVPRRQGKVINVASILGLGGGSDHDRRPATLAYSTSKGGVVNFTRALAVEWGRHNINVNAIAPGFFPTRMTKGILEMMGDDAAESGAAAARRRARRPEGAGRGARLGRRQVHHRPDHRHRRRRDRDVKRRPTPPWL